MVLPQLPIFRNHSNILSRPASFALLCCRFDHRVDSSNLLWKTGVIIPPTNRDKEDHVQNPYIDKIYLHARRTLLAGAPILALTLAGASVETQLARANSETSPSAELPAVAVYGANLAAVNSQGPASGAKGTAHFEIKDDDFSAHVEASGLAPNTIQAQHVHAGSRCPNPGDDTNHDGYIDVVEAAAATGKILIPLDNDLGSQVPGRGAPPNPSPGLTPSPNQPPGAGPGPNYPKTNSGGEYNYNQSGSYSKMMSDLHQSNPDPNSGMAKLQPGEDLKLEQRVVEIHGVPDDTPLPPTVQSIAGLSPQITLPVACGTIEKIAGNPPPSKLAPSQITPPKPPAPPAPPTPPPAPTPVGPKY
jgi:hypothetical protein